MYRAMRPVLPALRRGERSMKWCSGAVAESARQEEGRQGPKRMKSPPSTSADHMMTLFGVTGLVGTVALTFYYSDHSPLEKQLRKEMAEKQSSGVKRADPHAVTKAVSSFLRFSQPEAAPAVAQLGISLAVAGHTEGLREHAFYSLVSDLKDDNAVMSWADLGAFVAYQALREMGAPLVFITPSFGRTEQETSRRGDPAALFPPSPEEATHASVAAWAGRVGLTLPQAIAVLGGQRQGSLLFGNTRERDITTERYGEALAAYHRGDTAALQTIPYGSVFVSSPETVQCSTAYASDPLYWNKYFAQGLENVLTHGWFSLKPLPNRLHGTTLDASWAARQKQVYGIEHGYQGSGKRD